MTVKKIVLSLVPSPLRKYTDKIENSPLGYRLAKGAFWSLAGTIISRGIALLVSIIVARILGKEGFGELGIVQSTVGMFGVFAGFGMGLTANKHVAEYRVKEPIKAGHIIALSSLVAIITGVFISFLLLVFSRWLAVRTLAAPHLTNLIRISSALLFLSAINGAQTGALAGFEAFKAIAKVNLFAGILTFPLVVGGTLIYGLTGAMYGLILSLGVNCLANHIVLRREAGKYNIPITYSGSFAEWPVLWKFSLPAVLTAAMVGPVNWASNAMLVNQANGYAEMGIYNAATQWRQLLMFLPGITVQAILPIMASSENRFSTVRQIYTIFKINAVLALPFFITLSLLSPVIMGFYGPSFADKWPIFIVLQCSAFLQVLQSPVTTYWAASGQLWFNFSANIVWGGLVIGLSWLLISMGAMGLAWALLISFIVFGMVMIFSLRKTFRHE